MKNDVLNASTTPGAVAISATRATVRDVSAVSISTLCIMHCLLVPLMAAAMPAGALWLENEWVHRVLVLASIPISGYSIYSSIVGRENLQFTAGAIIGLSSLVAAAFVEPLHDYETVLTLLGGVILGGSHIFRWRRQHHHMQSQQP